MITNKTLEQMFQEYKDAVIPLGLTENQMANARNTFYAGLGVMFKHITDFDKTDTDTACQAELQNISDQLKNWLNEPDHAHETKNH